MENLIRRIEATEMPYIPASKRWCGDFVYQNGQLIYVHEPGDLEQLEEGEIQEHVAGLVNELYDFESQYGHEPERWCPDSEEEWNWCYQNDMNIRWHVYHAHHFRDDPVKALRAGDVDKAIKDLGFAHKHACYCNDASLAFEHPEKFYTVFSTLIRALKLYKHFMQQIEKKGRLDMKDYFGPIPDEEGSLEPTP